MLSTNLRITLVVALVCYFVIILIFLKNKTLELKYTLLWILAGFIMAILVAYPSLLQIFVRIVGIESNMNGLFIFCIAFLMILVMSLTAIVSNQNRKIRKLIQIQSLMGKKIEDLEKIMKESVEK